MSTGRPSLTVGEVARQFGVSPATVQRWVDKRKLRAERTAGGHRRIPLAEVRRLAAAKLRPPRSSASHWLETLFSGETSRVKASLLDARRLHGSWAKTADEVAAAIVVIGKRWEIGLCAVFEEHCASEALRRASAICAEDIPRSAQAPLAALFSVEGERHTLGLSLAELVLAEAGWRVLWLGEGFPRDELKRLSSVRKPHLIVVSASIASRPRAIGPYQKALVTIARADGMTVVLGGKGAWAPTRAVKRAITFAELSRVSARVSRRVQHGS
jgi:MerR family transcriptional regulator, light-induced transcriptional regulator